MFQRAKMTLVYQDVDFGTRGRHTQRAGRARLNQFCYRSIIHRQIERLRLDPKESIGFLMPRVRVNRLRRCVSVYIRRFNVIVKFFAGKMQICAN